MASSDLPGLAAARARLRLDLNELDPSESSGECSRVAQEMVLQIAAPGQSGASTCLGDRGDSVSILVKSYNMNKRMSLS